MDSILHRSIIAVGTLAALVTGASAQVDVAWRDSVVSSSQLEVHGGRLAAMPDGGLVVVTDLVDWAATTPSREFELARLDENGDRIWSRRLPAAPAIVGGFAGTEWPGQLASDDGGRFYFSTARTHGAHLRAFDGDGAQLWSTTILSAASTTHLFPTELRRVPNGELVLVGVNDVLFSSAPTRPISVHHLSAGTGDLVRASSVAANDLIGAAIAEDGAVALVVGHPMRVERFDAQADYLGSTPLAVTPGLQWTSAAVEFDAGGRLVVALSGFQFTSTRAQEVFSFDAAGALEWHVVRPGESGGAALRPDGALVLGASGRPGEPLRILDRAGQLAGQVPTPGPSASFGRVHALPNSGVVVSGRHVDVPGAPPPYDPFVHVYGASGSLELAIDPSITDDALAYAMELAVDPRGNAFVGVDVQGVSAPIESDRQVRYKLVLGGDVGAAVCAPAVVNSTGAPATVRAVGSDELARDNVTLLFEQGPPGAPLLALAARQTTFVPGAGGSQGALCLGGPIGRYVGPGQVRRLDGAGRASLQLELAELPTPTGLVVAAVGETWTFQGWYRDANPGATSNFTDATSVLIR